MSESSLEKGKLQPKSPETTPAAPERVMLPLAHKSLVAEVMEAVESLEIGKVAETTSEDRSQDIGGGGGKGAAIKTAQKAAGPSARDLAIANIPEPARMQKELQSYIHKEVKKLQKEANKITKLNQPGKSFQLNELYARIRSLRALLAELAEASYEVAKKFFIRVFIDKQAIL